MSWKAAMDELMATSISEQNVKLLKKESGNYLICDPSIIMNLRHQRVKRISKARNQVASNYDIISTAKRLILKEEFEKLTKKKTLETVDKEINKFKKQLEKNTNQFKLQIKTLMWPVGALSRNAKPLEESISHMQDNTALVPGNENIEPQHFVEKVTNSDVIPKIMICFRNKFNGSDSFSSRTLNTPENIEPVHIVDRIHFNQEFDGEFEHTVCREAEEKDLYKQNLMILTWKKWIKYTQKQKTNNLYIDQNINLESQHITDVRKYWNIWKDFIKEKKSCKAANENKKQCKEKIDIFLRMLQQQKHIMNSESKSREMISECKSTVQFNEKSSFVTSNLSKLHMRRNINVGVSMNNRYGLVPELSVPVSNQSKSFNHRFQVQQQIIAHQKAKLEEQHKLIEELKLAQIIKETNISTKEVCKEFNETLLCCDSKLKGKAQNVKIALSIPQCKETEKVKLCCTVPPRLLTRMEERAKEREKRWKNIKEKKQKLEEERIKKLHNEENERKMEEENEKRKRLEERNEKRRIEKEIETWRKEERQRMHFLMHRAVEHHKICILKKYGILPMKKLLALRQEQITLAHKQYNRQLLLWHFYGWSKYIQSVVKQKTDIADAYFNVQLLRKGLHRFCLVRNDYVTKQQVAYDYWELKLQQQVFLWWKSYTLSRHLERSVQLQGAAMYYNRKLIVKVLQSWKHMPVLVQLEREKERRKHIWRKKVQEMLPDFKPGLALEDTY